jgi:hypothetical protein
VLITAGYIVFVLSYLLAWENLPKDQLILNRISWSTSDYVAAAAISFALYTYSLFRKGLEANVAEQIMGWAADPKNQKQLDAVLRNVLACEATGQALDVAVEYARKKLISTFEGKAGKEIAMFRKGIKAELPESVSKLFENKWFDNAVKAVSIIDGILKTLKGGNPPEPPAASE